MYLTKMLIGFTEGLQWVAGSNFRVRLEGMCVECPGTT